MLICHQALINVGAYDAKVVMYQRWSWINTTSAPSISCHILFILMK